LCNKTANIKWTKLHSVSQLYIRNRPKSAKKENLLHKYLTIGLYKCGDVEGFKNSKKWVTCRDTLTSTFDRILDFLVRVPRRLGIMRAKFEVSSFTGSGDI